MFDAQNIPEGMSAWEWQKRKLVARAIAIDQKRYDAQIEEAEREAELQRRTRSVRIVSPLQSLIDSLQGKRKGVLARLFSWWG
ncbi:hypothetical protein [Mesorhizobium sp. B4-1-4]|uniref:hypothetical protein n=1 Tax=Mesorhizobium sp. B4-1-4 TaxID=2589888 RepID=UPI00112D4A66|nr:hypothetical protein [Mesorhizobium sp. B4-1-4]UCI32550.1 hypothetical protein FJW03_03585 [Mesorhizobium sp. B4-1-4]